MVHTACELQGSALSWLKEVHELAIRRGDIVLVKILPEKSLDDEFPQLDKSFFPHETFTGAEWQFPYCPAVVREVITKETNTTYFGLSVYPLVRCSGGLSMRRGWPLERILVSWSPDRYVLEMSPCSVTDLSDTFVVDFHSVKGWIPEVVRVEEERALENGG